MQETQVQSLAREYPTGCEATKPVRLNYWACVLELGSHMSPCAPTTAACAPRACVPQQEKPPQRETHAPQLGSGSCLPQLEKSLCSKEDPEQTKINRWIKLYVSIIHAHTYIKPLWPSEKGQRLCYEVLEQAQLSDLWLQNRDQRWPSWLLVTGRKGQRVTSWGVTNRTAVYQVGSVLHSYLTFALS